MYDLMMHGGRGPGGRGASKYANPHAGAPKYADLPWPDGGNASMPYDGMFTDNVFLTQSWLKRDIHGRPFYPDTHGKGVPDDPTTNAKAERNVLDVIQTSEVMAPPCAPWTTLSTAPSTSRAHCSTREHGRTRAS